MFKKIKKLLCLSVLISLCSSVFAAGGVMKGEKDIKMVQTQYFDIIFAESTADSAALLYANADKIYLDLAEMYNWSKSLCHMPVILSSKPEIYNAWFSDGYYNHIVLLVSPVMDSLDNQRDNLLWTFRHELTHAFTYNMKNDVIKAIDYVLSDAFSLAIFTVTPGMAEGATVTSESYEGFGRLNDEFAKQVVKQAKIENLFPDYGDTKGASSASRINHYYYFNGAFHEYLQKTYGLNKYRDLWYKSINDYLSFSLCFKKVYGIKLKKAWKDFMNSYEVPAIPANPVSAGYANDFFDSTTANYSNLNLKGAFAEDLSISEKGIVYKDSFNGSVYFVSSNELKNSTITPKCLFTMRGIDTVTQSSDGKFITVTYNDRNTSVYLSKVKIYNTETEEWYTPEFHGIKSANILKNGKDYYLYGLQFEAGKNRIGFNKLEFDSKDSIIGVGEEVSHALPEGKNVSYFTQISDGKIAYISNERLNFSIQTMDLNGKLLDTYYIPAEEFKNFYIHYLSSDPKNPSQLYFSWVSEGTMPRAGSINLDEGEFVLSQDDISGGMYSPVVYEDELFYFGEFYQYNRLFRKADGFNETVTYGALIESEEDLNYAGEGLKVVDVPALADVAIINDYNPLKYMKRGLLLPFSTCVSQSFDSTHYSSYSMPYGFKYTTKNPWDDLLFTLSGGYGYSTDSYGLYTSIARENMGVGATNAFTWNFENMLEFDSNGFKAERVSFNTSSLLYSGFNSRFQISPKVLLHIGRSNENDSTLVEEEKYENVIAELFGIHKGKYKSTSDTLYFYNENLLMFMYDNFIYSDDNAYNRKGFYAGFVPGALCSYNVTDKQKDYAFCDVNFFTGVYIPKLLPIENTYGKVVNLPVKLFASVFSTSFASSNFVALPSTTAIFDSELALASAEVLLYSHQLQKSYGPSGFIYLYDFNVSLFGAVGYGYPDKLMYSQGLGIIHVNEIVNQFVNEKTMPAAVAAIKFTLSNNFLNFGIFARSSLCNYVYVAPTVLINKKRYLNPIYELTFGLDLKF